MTNVIDLAERLPAARIERGAAVVLRALSEGLAPIAAMERLEAAFPDMEGPDMVSAYRRACRRLAAMES